MRTPPSARAVRRKSYRKSANSARRSAPKVSQACVDRCGGRKTCFWLLCDGCGGRKTCFSLLLVVVLVGKRVFRCCAMVVVGGKRVFRCCWSEIVFSVVFGWVTAVQRIKCHQILFTTDTPSSVYRLRLNCPLGDCEWEGRLSALQPHHEEDCDFSPMSCQHEG